MLARISEVPGVIETELTGDDLERLPAAAPPAPWRARAQGVFWWERPDRDSRAAVVDALPGALQGDCEPLLTVGAMIAYQETPVGPYSEVLAIVVLRRGGEVLAHVPFIAVDSPASVVGGRANWALPKALVEFDGAPANQTTMRATGPLWAIEATPRAHGPPLPWLLPRVAKLVQIGPAGVPVSARPSGRGTARLARVNVEVRATPSLSGWFPAGQRFGALSGSLTGTLPTGIQGPYSK